MNEFFDTIYQFITQGIFDLLTQAIIFLGTKLVVVAIETKIHFVTLAWQIGSAVLAELNITAAIEQAWGNLDSQTYDALLFFRVPDALNIILAAYPAKMFLRMVGF